MTELAIRPLIPRRIDKGEEFKCSGANYGTVKFFAFGLLEKGQKVKMHEN